MRHKYPTPALVLSRAPLGEANTLMTVLTADVGLVRARAQGLRKPGAKLAAALPTFCESELTLVRGAEGWRIAGALLRENWFTQMTRAARLRAARVSTLFLRLVPGEAVDSALFDTLREFFTGLALENESEHDAIECVTVLKVLSILGLYAGVVPSRAELIEARPTFIKHINRGIEASGL